MNIFEALRVSHQTQRELTARLLATAAGTPEREQVFLQLKSELVAHETAEERCFYVPLFEHDQTVNAARHAIAEHHLMDEMVESLEDMDPATAQWQASMEGFTWFWRAITLPGSRRKATSKCPSAASVWPS